MEGFIKIFIEYEDCFGIRLAISFFDSEMKTQIVELEYM